MQSPKIIEEKVINQEKKQKLDLGLKFILILKALYNVLAGSNLARIEHLGVDAATQANLKMPFSPVSSGMYKRTAYVRNFSSVFLFVARLAVLAGILAAQLVRIGVNKSGLTKLENAEFSDLKKEFYAVLPDLYNDISWFWLNLLTAPSYVLAFFGLRHVSIHPTHALLVTAGGMFAVDLVISLWAVNEERKAKFYLFARLDAINAHEDIKKLSLTDSKGKKSELTAEIESIKKHQNKAYKSAWLLAACNLTGITAFSLLATGIVGVALTGPVGWGLLAVGFTALLVTVQYNAWHKGKVEAKTAILDAQILHAKAKGNENESAKEFLELTEKIYSSKNMKIEFSVGLVCLAGSFVALTLMGPIGIAIGVGLGLACLGYFYYRSKQKNELAICKAGLEESLTMTSIMSEFNPSKPAPTLWHSFKSCFKRKSEQEQQIRHYYGPIGSDAEPVGLTESKTGNGCFPCLPRLSFSPFWSNTKKRHGSDSSGKSGCVPVQPASKQSLGA